LFGIKNSIIFYYSDLQWECSIPIPNVLDYFFFMLVKTLIELYHNVITKINLFSLKNDFI